MSLHRFLLIGVISLFAVIFFCPSTVHSTWTKLSDVPCTTEEEIKHCASMRYAGAHFKCYKGFCYVCPYFGKTKCEDEPV